MQLGKRQTRSMIFLKQLNNKYQSLDRNVPAKAFFVFSINFVLVFAFKNRRQRLINKNCDQCTNNTLHKSKRQIENTQCRENILYATHYLLVHTEYSGFSTECFKVYRINDKIIQRQAYYCENQSSNDTAYDTVYDCSYSLDNLAVTRLAPEKDANGISYRHTLSCFAGVTEHAKTTQDYYNGISDKKVQYTYNYTGDVQTFTAPAEGVYTLEAWGGD